MTHLSREELRRWWDAGDPSDRERITGHLAACDECVALYGQIMDERRLEGTAPAIAPALVTAAYAAYAHAAPQARPRQAAWRRPWVAPLGAAAALLVGIGLYSIRGRETPLVPPADESVRSTVIQTVSPTGRVTPPFVFEWSSPLEASAYDVIVYGAGGEVVWTTKVGTPRLDAPGELLRRLRPDVEYTWQVDAFNMRGERTIQSRRQPFVVAPRVP